MLHCNDSMIFGIQNLTGTVGGKDFLNDVPVGT